MLDRKEKEAFMRIEAVLRPNPSTGPSSLSLSLSLSAVFSPFIALAGRADALFDPLPTALDILASISYDTTQRNTMQCNVIQLIGVQIVRYNTI